MTFEAGGESSYGGGGITLADGEPAIRKSSSKGAQGKIAYLPQSEDQAINPGKTWKD